jgi:endonuclease/exonuclease/phosphatase family metal-dependent hydrolase
MRDDDLWYITFFVRKTLTYWAHWRKLVVVGIASSIFQAQFLCAQIPMSAGTYSQNFDSLASSGTVNWTNNVTLAGWYASKGSADASTYIANAGTTVNGSIYSFGTNGVNPLSDRALGSVAASSTAYAYGVRFTNDTGLAQSNITISYTGEQWRNANNTGAVTNILSFSYRLTNSPLTNADAINSQTWTSVNALDFSSPIVNVGGSGTGLDGNAAPNRQIFTNIVLTGVIVPPGQELFLRWRDPDDSGSDAGMSVDDLTVTFGTNAPAGATPPSISTQPQDQTATAGDTVSFNVVASGTAPLNYQWKSNNVIIPGATNDTFMLSSVTTNLSGSSYFVTITNSAGSTNSATATLTVNPATFAITYLHYNVNGNSVTGTDPTNWAVTAPQVQAIGRQIDYLNPDIIALNEIPTAYKWQMTNWANSFFPGFYLATNAIGDGFINNFIASRWPIIRSQSWLSSSNLANFGYTNGNITVARDLFEAQIAVPNFAQPLHVFVAHLKATTSGGQDDADRRGAEANCISNFFVTVFLTGTNKLHPYILSGDMNEDIFRPETNKYPISRLPIQHLTAPATGLQFTTPTNIYDLSTSNDMTESIQATRLTVRFDYIMPCPLMFSNIASSQIFRTDKLPSFPPNLFSNDDKMSSDHLPVVMIFNNPFYKPFNTTSFARNGTNVAFNWQTVPGQTYRVEGSTNLTAWTALATNLTATNYSSAFATNSTPDVKFFRVRSP